MYCRLEGMDSCIYIHTFHLEGSLYHHIASLKLVLLLLKLELACFVATL